MLHDPVDVPWTALVLAGGSSRRLGHDKARATIGGRSLLDHVLAAVPADVPCIVVGPRVHTSVRDAVFVTEDRPGGGPVSGIAAGIGHVATPLVAVLAVDMPFAGAVITRLARMLASADQSVAAVVTVDADGRRQQLAAAYRTDALRVALTTLGDPRNRAVRELQDLLEMAEMAVTGTDAHDLLDVDTPEDLDVARRSVPLATADGSRDRNPMDRSPMDEWITAATKALGIEHDVAVDTVLDVAREAAHGVERPAAPVTTYLMGYAVASGMSLEAAAQRLTELAQEWPPTA